jgi:hypothetical protein
MKYPFLFLFVSVLLASFVFVVVGIAAFAEVRDLIAGKGKVSVGGSLAD